MSKIENVRVRFAPSPTGPLHIGGVRTALFNYLFAKKHGGAFLLRIEDTDSTRFVEGAEAYILEAFAWLGIAFDEGVGIGGPYGPYKQSERKSIYKKYVDELLEKGLAYYAFDTPEELDAMRKRLEAEKSRSLQYDASTRQDMKNSLTLSPEEVKEKIENGTNYVVRMKIDPGETLVVNDLIRGKVEVQSDILDDKVLYKSSDGLPTYHLANIVDDHCMKISHVIRGEEWLPSAPLHVLLYRYLGWSESMPAFAHLPLLLKPDGNGKLSKRDGDRLGFPVFPLQWKDPKTGDFSQGYRENGYFPEAVVNMLAFLGWNPGTEQELFSLEELAEVFSLERVNKSGAKFNLDKALWYNQQYLHKKSNEAILPAFKSILKEKWDTGVMGEDAKNEAAILISNEKKLLQIIGLIKERMHFTKEFWEQTYFFFVAPTTFDEKVIKKRWSAETPTHLQQIVALIAEEPNMDATVLENKVNLFIENNALNMGKIMNCLRLSLVGTSMGPHLWDIVEIIGKEETIKRIDFACKTISC
ncbi:MAG: glutamate--tRNA ligase [Bacteroidales bacterium]